MDNLDELEREAPEIGVLHQLESEGLAYRDIAGSFQLWKGDETDPCYFCSSCGRWFDLPPRSPWVVPCPHCGAVAQVTL